MSEVSFRLTLDGKPTWYIEVHKENGTVRVDTGHEDITRRVSVG